MPDARLIIRFAGEPDREVKLCGCASIGRASDNSIKVEAKGVSRYHAAIEDRGGEFWLNDLGSTNGTSINDDLLTAARKLEDGDMVSVGGAAILEFRAEGAISQADCDEAAGAGSEGREAAAAAPMPPRTGRNFPQVAIALVAGLTLIGIVAFALASATGREPDAGIARIISPVNGAFISEPAMARIKVENSKSISRVIYELDGVEIARSDAPPEYEARLDPGELKEKLLNIDGPRKLSAVIEYKRGRKESLPETVLLTFNLKQQDVLPASTPTAPASNNIKSIADVDLRAKAEELAYKISKQRGYLFTPEFINEIERRRNDYSNVSINKGNYDEIERACATVEGLPPKLGAILAMSLINKIKEDPAMASGAGFANQVVGLFWMPKDIARQRECIQPGNESKFTSLAETSECASSYLKALWGQFQDESDFMYAIACYGKGIGDASKLNTRLQDYEPDARKNFLAMVKAGVVSRDEADRVFRFFAAASFGNYP